MEELGDSESEGKLPLGSDPVALPEVEAMVPLQPEETLFGEGGTCNWD